jgi:hypothetical protein
MKEKILMIIILVFLAPLPSLLTIKSTWATSNTLQPAYFLENPIFVNGLQGWSKNLLENLGTNIITTDSTYGPSAKIYVSGAPGAGGVEQRITQPILKGTTIVIKVYQTNTADFGAWSAFLYNGTFNGIDPNSKHTFNQYAANVAGAAYTPLDGELTTIVEYTTNRTEGYKTVYWTADKDYPAGTWFILHGVVWPGSGTFWFLGVYTLAEVEIDKVWLVFAGHYSQAATSVTRTIYISTSHQVTGKDQSYILVDNNDIQYVDIPGFPIRYGNLTSPGYEVGQYTFVNEVGAFSGKIQFFDITSYVVSNGIITYYVAVDNPGADISFRASIIIHLSNGTEIHYPLLSTLSFGDHWWSRSRGCAGQAAEVTLAPITQTYISHGDYESLLNQLNALQDQYDTLKSQNFQLQTLAITTTSLLAIFVVTTVYFFKKSRRKPS